MARNVYDAQEKRKQEKCSFSAKYIPLWKWFIAFAVIWIKVFSYDMRREKRGCSMKILSNGVKVLK